MQPFDALTMRAILAEAKPVLLNRKVEKIQQISRDEVLLTLRAKAGSCYLLVSAQASFGRLCLVLNPPSPKSANPPPFCQLLRKYLGSASLVGLEQIPGERVVDITFACVDELGNRFSRILTAEIMGRHSNLILWDSESEKILGASHNVTAEMSRQREIAPGLKYVRPPRQEKNSIFSVSEEEFKNSFYSLKKLIDDKNPQQLEDKEAEIAKTYEQWLMQNFAGLGRHLAEEIVEGSGLPAEIDSESLSDANRQKCWTRLETIQKIVEFKPSMRLDLSRFSVLSWWKDLDNAEETLWQSFPTVNDLVDAYFRGVQLRTEMQQLKDRIRTELKAEQDKLQNRLDAAAKLLVGSNDLDRFRKYGDTILAHAQEISAGQTVLDCADMFSENGKTLSIELNPNLSASQNAQNYYRQYAKSRTRTKTADASSKDAGERLSEVQGFSQALDAAENLQDLQLLKEKVLDRGKKIEHPRPSSPTQQKERTPQQRLMSTKSSDGFTIIVGRNRIENDVLVSKLTQPHDIWMHAQGLEGAHVVVKLPNKKDPPLTTLKEAAQIAARFSKTGLGGKVKIVYTYGKWVRKIGKDKPGMVRYENEKTLEIDTAAPMPPAVRRLFS